MSVCPECGSKKIEVKGNTGLFCNSCGLVIDEGQFR